MERWPQHKAYFWEYAPFFRGLIPLVAGILFYSAGLIHLPAPCWLIIAIAALCIYTALAISFKEVKKPLIAFILLHITLFCCGNLLSVINDSSSNSNYYGNSLNKEATYLALVSEMPAEKENTWKLQAEIISHINNGKASVSSGKGLIYLHKDRMPMLLQKGDTIIVPGNWERIKNAGNPYEFDYATYCSRNNIYYRQFCYFNQVRLYAAVIPDKAPITEQVHNWCMTQLDKYITEPKTKGLIQAMLLGDEVNLDDELRQSFSDTGIVHIIAISGGNVMMFFTLISVLLWWVRHRKHLWLKYLFALPLVWFYVVMAGASPSAIRAAIMFSIFAWGLMFQKNNNSLNQLFATAFLLLCAQPMWLYSIGFQLSFIAVLSLILFYPAIFKLWLPKNKWVKKKWGIIAASLAAEILIAPLVVYYFHNFPLLFLIANVAAYVFMSLVLILGIVIIAVSWWPILAKMIGTAIVWLVMLFDKIVQGMQNCNPASFHFLKLTAFQLLFLYIAITGIGYFIFRKKKLAIFLGLSSLVALLALLTLDKFIHLKQERFVVYNVSKGNHIEYISDGQYHIVGVDTLPAKKVNYAVNASHIQWQAWRKGNDIAEELFLVNGKTILVLNKPLPDTSKFNVDYLIVNYTGPINPQQLSKTYNPKLLVVGNNYTRKQQQQWITTAHHNNIPLHILSRDGAFVLEE